ncbi:MULTISPECIES: hypothetical protein [Bacillaceae]|jgi:hypothetical protein|uniref:Uncharacterized protein n=1 Tax=Niallia circulans TaxID=1397 RepID=A0A941GFZ8_NIACI|nr:MULTISPECIES: hypothetical protein [Bacillaceae]SLL35286.1 Uncharacterised protein [Mycobacteroides abscessus subsp. abscessus]HEO8421590.1 hypothetical protein [Yersinia enterocolitica]KAB7670286.1 hypothetical protein F9279_08455 [Bacillus sp. B1-b2]MCB5237142.1 hypothetical protein [Niallia circulans]MED3794459.1 hypothetical protein [Niallia alba]
MNTILTFLNGFVQYRRGKQTGLAGLLGLIIFVLAVYRWDITYPILESLKIIDFFDNLGLIYEGEPGTTLYAIMLFLSRAAIVIMFFLAVALILSLFLMIIGSSKLGQNLLAYVVLVIMTPLAVLWIIGYEILHLLGFRTKKEKAEESYENWHQETFGEHSDRYKEEQLKYEESRLSPSDLLKKYCTTYYIEDTISQLNRLPMFGDTVFMLGETYDGSLYILMPDPLLKYNRKMDIEYRRNYSTPIKAVPFTVKNVVLEKKDDSNIMKYRPEKMVISLKKNPEYNVNSELIKYEFLVDIDFLDIKSFYMPDLDLKDIKHYISSFGKRNDYRSYLEDKVEKYFSQKQHLLNFLYRDISSEKFQEVTNDLKELNATNEDIVKMINDSPKILGVNNE